MDALFLRFFDLEGFVLVEENMKQKVFKASQTRHQEYTLESRGRALSI